MFRYVHFVLYAAGKHASNIKKGGAQKILSKVQVSRTTISHNKHFTVSK